MAADPKIVRLSNGPEGIVELLVKKVIEDPVAGAALCREYDMWEIVRHALAKPLRIRLAREDINYFIEYVIVDPETNEYAHQEPFHTEWQLLMSTCNRVIIVAPRGHGKTSQVAGRVVWEIGRNHNIRIKVISNKDKSAKDILGLVRQMIKLNERVKEVFPDLEIDEERTDTQSAFFVKRSNTTMRDATFESSGVLSSGAGGRADLLICDDVVDPKNSIINPALREQVIRVLRETWFSLVAATGRIIYVATPYHVLDATHMIKETQGDIWTIWWVPAVKYVLQFDEDALPIMVDDEDRPGEKKQLVKKEFLWPSKWNDERLAAKRFELGPRTFAAQYLLNAMSDEDRTFPEDSLQKSYNRDLRYIGEGVEEDWPTFGGVDLASTFGKRSAWTVIVTLAKNPDNGKYRIKEIVRKKMKFTTTMRDLIEQFNRHHWRMCYVENNQYQRAVVDALEERAVYIPVEGFNTGVGKMDEEVGLPGLNVAFDRGLFELPAALFPLDFDDQTVLGALMAELQSHPGGESKDIIMALWFAYRAAIKGQGADFEDAYAEAAGAA